MNATCEALMFYSPLIVAFGLLAAVLLTAMYQLGKIAGERAERLSTQARGALVPAWYAPPPKDQGLHRPQATPRPSEGAGE